MSKSPEQRINKQADKLGLTEASRRLLHEDWKAGKFKATEPGTGKAIRQYVRESGDRFTADASFAAENQAQREFKKGNPFDPKSPSFSLTKCGEIYKSNPKLAESLARSAGVSLDGKPLWMKKTG